MELDDFSIKIANNMNQIGVNLKENEINNFYKYMNLLIEWNKFMNLTAITDPDEVILKHFVDSLTISKYVDNQKKIIDIGTGAGFPGIPLGIYRKDLEIVLMDSLNKRIKFLDEVCSNIQLKNINTIHSRAEDLANDKNYREQYDYATSRAVASLNVLLEYMLPFVKVGGKCICMKGANISDEINISKKALSQLGGIIESVEEFQLPDSDIVRNIVIVKKVKETPNVYPRKAGVPSKNPIQ